MAGSGSSSPDLIVESPSVDNTTPTPGQSLTLSATVRNQGTAEVAATTLRYYQSSDATITTDDTPVGKDAVSELAASTTSEQSSSVPAPSTAGTYYYGACVDPVRGESNTTNNCSDGVRVTVSSGGGGGGGSGGGGGGSSSPDLIVESPSVDNTTLTLGQSLTLSATVRNRGTGQSPETTLRYYQSFNATITTSDTEVGTDLVNGLSASRTALESISLTAPSSSGTYYYGACVDAVSGESNTDNNCSEGVRVMVSHSSPDLVVESPSVDNTTPTTGQSFTLRATVRNQGTGQSPETTLYYYQSSDATISRHSSNDRIVGKDAVSGLSASGSSSFSVNLGAPTTPGTYYYGACVMPFRRESNSGNNCSDGVRVMVSYSGGGDSERVEIPDARLRAVILDSLGKARGAPITRADMATLRRIKNHGNIYDLTGLEYATNLEYLNLISNPISDITALAGLTNLTVLWLESNQISDITALARLTNLDTLGLDGNQLSDITALAGLTNLEYLGLERTQLSDIAALAGLTKLTYLSLISNRISDITVLSKLTNLEFLFLENNQITVGALSGLTIGGIFRASGGISDNGYRAIGLLSILTDLSLKQMQITVFFRAIVIKQPEFL